MGRRVTGPPRIIEVVSPGGFEDYFREMADVFREGGEAGPDPARFVGLSVRYGLDMDLSSVPALCERFGVTHPLA